MDAGASLARSTPVRRALGAVLVIRTRWLVLSMVAAVCAIGALAYWDEARRSEAGLADFGDEQAAVAAAAGLAVRGELTGAPSPPSQPDAAARSRAAALLAPLERDGVRLLLVSPVAAGGAPDVATLDGHPVRIARLTDGVARGARVVLLARDEAPALGFPARKALVGLHRLASGWTVGVAATAERQRDRDRAGLWRLLLSMALATGLVAVFGGLTLARQRTQLVLARELAVAETARARDAELERLSRAATMAAIGSGVAHELSTPLGVIVGRAEQLLSRAAGDERTAKNAQKILDQADHIDRVVRGLLGLARGAPIALQEIEPGRLVREAGELVEHRFARAGVALVLAIGDGLPAVRCEPLLFKHALVNLLLNACDASPAGATVRLDVAAEGTAEGAAVAFVVTDEGEGITPGNAARALEPFFTTKPAGRGTGLGLAIANEIASSHRGSLAIAPRAPRGTRACVTIPIDGGAHA
ncbi:MAG TPA: HAMP domain-containing sensor histidine kinase [Kofleriaceae bacterium]|jgi:signal transduction histidine kinase|nr:HAMP domain-containing sensor histidine kinase [Kofleriaceae bacterium]